MRPSRDLVSRGRIVSIVVTVLLGLVSTPTAATAKSAPSTIAAAAACSEAGFPAIRTADPALARLINSGAALSATLAAEICAILGSDVVVFIESAPAMPATVDGYVAFLSATPIKRFLRIRLRARLEATRMLALIGHEFQHVLEIARHPEVIDSTSLSTMYRLYGKGTGRADAWDSEAAVKAGVTVLRELLRSNFCADDEEGEP